MSEIQYDPSCVDCRHDAGKDAPETTWQCSAHVRAERDWLRARLAMKWTIEEQYEAACGDRDALGSMVETLRQELGHTVSQRDSWHAECEGWRETSAKLQERLDQFEAYAITVKSALDDRAARDALRGVVRQLDLALRFAEGFIGSIVECNDQRFAVSLPHLSDWCNEARRALAASESEVRP